MNNVNIIGHITRDLELRYTPQGTAVVNFSIAINERYKDQKIVHFFNVETWGKTAENCNQHLTKGKKVAITGSLKQSRWQDKEGKNRSKVIIRAINVEFLTPKSADNVENVEIASGPGEETVRIDV